MTLESDLFLFLKQDSILAGYLNERIYPMTLPQGVVLPALTYQRVADIRSYNMEEADGCVEARIQIDTWAPKYITMKRIVQRIMDLLNGLRSGMGSTPVLGVFLEVGTELFEDEPKIYRSMLDFRFIYHEN